MLSSAKCQVRRKHVLSMHGPHRLQPCALHQCRLLQRLLSVRVRTAMPTSKNSDVASEGSVQDIMSTDIPNSDVLQVPNIRGQLKGQDSPFCEHDNRGGGCDTPATSSAITSCTKGTQSAGLSELNARSTCACAGRDQYCHVLAACEMHRSCFGRTRAVARASNPPGIDSTRPDADTATTTVPKLNSAYAASWG